MSNLFKVMVMLVLLIGARIHTHIFKLKLLATAAEPFMILYSDSLTTVLKS